MCHDIGKKLGIAAAMENLIRTRVSVFRLEDAITLSQIQKMVNESVDEFEKKVVKVDSLFPDYSRLYVNDKGARYLANGNSLKKDDFIDEGVIIKQNQDVLVYDEEKHFKAIYAFNGKEYKVVKMF